MFLELVIVLFEIQVSVSDGGCVLSTRGDASECGVDAFDRGITAEPVLGFHNWECLFERS